MGKAPPQSTVNHIPAYPVRKEFVSTRALRQVNMNLKNHGRGKVITGPTLGWQGPTTGDILWSLRRVKEPASASSLPEESPRGLATNCLKVQYSPVWFDTFQCGHCTGGPVRGHNPHNIYETQIACLPLPLMIILWSAGNVQGYFV